MIVISFEDLKKKNEGLDITDKYLLRQTFEKYASIYHIVMRQLGEEEYNGNWTENETSEKMFFELLTPNQKTDLENIALKLEEILRSVMKVIYKK